MPMEYRCTRQLPAGDGSCHTKAGVRVSLFVDADEENHGSVVPHKQDATG